MKLKSVFSVTPIRTGSLFLQAIEFTTGLGTDLACSPTGYSRPLSHSFIQKQE